MMETMLSKKELDFNALEKEIYRIGCEFAAGLMSQVLEIMDEHLEKTRDKKQLRHKGTHRTTLKTLMGEVPYDRTLYETKLETGEKLTMPEDYLAAGGILPEATEVGKRACEKEPKVPEAPPGNKDTFG